MSRPYEVLADRARKLEDEAIVIAEQKFPARTLAVVKQAAVAHAELKLKAAELLYRRSHDMHHGR